MDLQHETRDNIEIVKLPQRILMADAKATRAEMKSFLENKPPLLALDLEETEFIDSSGLAVLVNTLQAARRKSGEVCLFSMRDTVRALFELTRLHTVFPIEDDLDSAIKRLQP